MSKNLYQKLLIIQQKINGLGKDKSTYNYKYVTGDKLLGEVKPIMNELGLILKQEVLSIENIRQDYDLLQKDGTIKHKSEILSKVMMRFTWIDTETGEKDENLFGANGQNDWDKGVGSALTYAERYFILKYFHIATDEDDIDNDQREKAPAVPKPQPSQSSHSTPTTPSTPSTELPWLNVMDKDKNFTREWSRLIAKKQAKEPIDIKELRKFYKISKEVEAKINELINQ
jgi:hypothetical protein